MTAHSELGTRAEAQAHDITAPDATQQALGAPDRGGEVGKRRYLRETLAISCVKDAAVGSTLVDDRLAFPASEFPNGVEVKAIALRHAVAVVETTDVYAVDTFTKYDGDGSNSAVVCTVTTQPAPTGVGTTVAHKKYDLTLVSTLASKQIPANGVLAIARTKTATGTQLPQTLYTVVVERL